MYYILTTFFLLVSQMDEDQFVAVQTIAGFNQIKKLTTDMKLIVEAIKSIECLKRVGVKLKSFCRFAIFTIRRNRY